MDFAQLEATLVSELASLVSVLDLIVKYEAYLQTVVPAAAPYIPLINKLDAALKAAQTALVTA